MGIMNIGYVGTVNVKYKLKNGKIIEKETHNSGLPNLFRIISKALTGESIYDERPIKIDLQEQEIGSTTWSSIINSEKISITVVYAQDSTGNWSTKINGTLSYDQLMVSQFNSTSSYRLVLQSSDNDLATISVPYSDLMQVSSGVQAIINWTLKIVNA